MSTYGKKALGLIASLWLTVCLVSTAHAQQAPDPLPQMQRVSEQMLSELQKNEAVLSKKPQVVYGIVNRILLPYVDLKAMARSALGRSAWMAVTPTEQQAFIDQFTLLMLKTYSAGLATFTDERVQFEPIRGGIPAGQTRVEVMSKIIRNDGPPIAVSYRLVYENKNGNPNLAKDWFVYDFSVEGVSMIESFRSQFAADLSSGITVAQLTQKLQAHNCPPGGKSACYQIEPASSN